MAKKSNKGAGSMLDLAMAAFAGTAAGFVVFAMPDWQFDRAVELSGLPLVLSAAEPPLGMTARIAAVAVAALGTWLLVWLVLRALSKKPPEPKRRSKPEQIDIPLPRIRRADAHPDAPARAPILAGLELGTPLDREPEEVAEVEKIEAAEEEWFAEDISNEEALPETVAEEADIKEESEEERELPQVLDATAPDDIDGDHERTSIGHLMQRLELGLLRRERNDWDAPSPEAAQRSEPSPQLDQRLRSAIDDLQRLAARGG